MITFGLTPRRAKRIIVITLLVLLIVGALVVARGFLGFRSDLRTLYRLKLGDSRQEVTYRLGFPPQVLGPRGPVFFGSELAGYGRPLLAVDGPAGDKNTMPPTKSVNDYSGWVFSPDQIGTDLTVEFDKAGRVTEVTCTAHAPDNPFACWLAGRWNGDSEEEVLKLGKPTRTTMTDVSKTIEYEDIGVAFTLTRGKAYSFAWSKPTKGDWALFRRYVISRLP